MHSKFYTEVLNLYHWMETAVAINQPYSDTGVFALQVACNPEKVSVVNSYSQYIRPLDRTAMICSPLFIKLTFALERASGGSCSSAALLRCDKTQHARPLASPEPAEVPAHAECRVSPYLRRRHS